MDSSLVKGIRSHTSEISFNMTRTAKTNVHGQPVNCFHVISMSCPSCSEAHHCAGQLKVTTSGRSPVVPVVQVNEVNVSAASEPCSACSPCRSFRHCTDCCQCPEGNMNAILLNMLKKT